MTLLLFPPLFFLPQFVLPRCHRRKKREREREGDRAIVSLCVFVTEIPVQTNCQVRRR